MSGSARLRRDEPGQPVARKPDGLSAPARAIAPRPGAGRLWPRAALLAGLGLLASCAAIVIRAGGLPSDGASSILHLLLTLASGLVLGGAAALRPRRSFGDEERALLEARLAAAEAGRARAEEESRAKSRFLAEMSHELRTPLNTVMGFSEMMAEEVLGPHRVAAYGGYARDIHACGRHLLALADDLLDLARIETGHRVLLETAVPFDLLAQECLAMMAPQAREKGVLLRDATARPPVRLWGDERALRQMALNLLANAVKFTPEGGEVSLGAGLTQEGAPFLAVEDTGRGLAERELPFEEARHRESRLDQATGRGAGLGLAIVEGLAGLHGATLSLARRPGGGTVATVVFPASRASLPRERRPARDAA